MDRTVAGHDLSAADGLDLAVTRRAAERVRADQRQRTSPDIGQVRGRTRVEVDDAAGVDRVDVVGADAELGLTVEDDRAASRPAAREAADRLDVVGADLERDAG